MPHFGSKEFERYLNFEFSSKEIIKEDFCCNKMQKSVTYKCDHDHDKWECGDQILHYGEVFDEYGLIIHDGGATFVSISYCPWCGKKLPESKRDNWFDELEELGFDNPLEQNIPEKYNSSKWYTSNANKT